MRNSDALRSGCSEYRVEHPRWKIWNATSFKFNADVASLYGEEFADVLNQPPRSAFIADGSPITVQRREVLQASGKCETASFLQITRTVVIAIFKTCPSGFARISAGTVWISVLVLK